MDISEQYGFDSDEFLALQKAYQKGELSLRTNVITHGNTKRVRPPQPDDTVPLPSRDSKAYAEGLRIITGGHYGMVFMNGGAATRFLEAGAALPKCGFEILTMEGRKRSFLELKLTHLLHAERKYGASIPAWILNSFSTHEYTREILDRNGNYGKAEVFLYTQGITKRVIPTVADIEWKYVPQIKALEDTIAASTLLSEERMQMEKQKSALETRKKDWISFCTPQEGAIFRDCSGNESYNPPGHLDTILWLVLDKSRPLLTMLKKGLTTIGISNIDNLAAMVDPALPGLLTLLQSTEGTEVLVEVAPKPKGQKGGSLARVYDPRSGKEHLQLIEEFAFPPDFDQDTIPEFNTATYTVSVESLLKLFDLSEKALATMSDRELREKIAQVKSRVPVYVAVKEIRETGENGQETVRPAVQFERLLGDITTLLAPRAVLVNDRFVPIKKPEEIEEAIPKLMKILKGKVVFV